MDFIVEFGGMNLNVFEESLVSVDSSVLLLSLVFNWNIIDDVVGCVVYIEILCMFNFVDLNVL